MNRRTQLALVVLGVLLSTSTIVAGTVVLNEGKDVGPNNTFHKANGPNVTIGESVQFRTENPWADANQITLEPWGNFTSSGDTEVRVETFNGTWTNLSQLDVTGADLTVDINDKPDVVVGGAVTELRYLNDSNTQLDDGQIDFEYSSSGSGSITLNSLPASTTFSAGKLGGGAGLGTFTSDATGQATISVDSATDAQVVLFTSASPTVDDSSATPTGDLATSTPTLEIDVNDSDFPTSQSDEVDVTWYVDGSSVATDTVTSNGTVSHTTSTLTGGDHTWHVELEDSYGNTAQSSTFSISVPDKILIFNETQPAQKVQSATVTLQFFGETGTVEERTTTNGEIDMTGLPVDEEFTVVAEADDYYTRRIYLKSIYDQAEIYLLNRTAISADSIVFELDDQTDRFRPEETTLRVEKPIKKDFDGDGQDETRYQTIAGDVFGASGEFPVDLESDTRYRLRVENDQGETRLLGSYTTSGDAVETLTIGALSFSDSRETGVSFQARMKTLENGNRFVILSFRDPDDDTSELQVEITEWNNASNVLKANTSVSGPLGVYAENVSVPASAPDNITYQVRWHATRGSADDGGTELVGDIPAIAKTIGMDPTVLSYAAYVMIAALTGLVVIFDDRLAAIVAVVAASALTMAGAIHVPGLALGIGGTIAVLYAVGRG